MYMKVFPLSALEPHAFKVLTVQFCTLPNSDPYDTRCGSCSLRWAPDVWLKPLITLLHPTHNNGDGGYCGDQRVGHHFPGIVCGPGSCVSPSLLPSAQPAAPLPVQVNTKPFRVSIQNILPSQALYSPEALLLSVLSQNYKRFMHIYLYDILSTLWFLQPSSWSIAIDFFLSGPQWIWLERWRLRASRLSWSWTTWWSQTRTLKPSWRTRSGLKTPRTASPPCPSLQS